MSEQIPLFHSVMRPPPEEEVATLAGVSVDELLSVLTSEPETMPQPKIPPRQRSKRPTLEAKLHKRIATLIEDAAVLGIALRIETRHL